MDLMLVIVYVVITTALAIVGITFAMPLAKIGAALSFFLLLCIVSQIIKEKL